ncbi:MAG: proprotein convertase P-domain-containing protein [Oligoflexia bacterium]|nr:proprotein convertase P-domain-containing protein [Oligoflexia bacterium]
MSIIKFLLVSLCVIFAFSALDVFAKVVSLDQWSNGWKNLSASSNTNIVKNKIYSNDFFAIDLAINDLNLNVIDSKNLASYFNGSVKFRGKSIDSLYEIDLFSDAINNNNNAYTTEIGKPKLPVIVRMVEVSSDNAKDLKVSINKNKEMLYDLQYFNDKKITPVQESVYKIAGAKKNIKWVIDENLYTSDQFYPKKDFEIKGVSQIRGKKVATIVFYPVKYNPVKNQLLIARNFNVNFQIVTNNENWKNRVESSEEFNKILSSLVMNYNGKSRAKINEKFSDNSIYRDTMLIVTDNTFVNQESFVNYVQLQRERGFNVIVQTMQGLPGLSGLKGENENTAVTDVALRSYIKDLYNKTNPRLAFVILVGDVELVPTHLGNAVGLDDSFPVDNRNNRGKSYARIKINKIFKGSHATDNFYRAIDKDDYISDIGGPDLMVSRIPVKEVSELNVVLGKIIKYQKKLFSDLSWIKNISFVATSDGGWYTVAEGTHNYVIQTYTGSKNYTGNYPAPAEVGGDRLYYFATNARTEHLTQMFKEGRSIINYSGHGGNTSWAGPDFVEDDIKKLDHPNALPFVISNACVTNTFAESYDCFGEMWLKHPQGAISFWGASNNSTWDEDDILEKRFFEGVFNNPNQGMRMVGVTLGEATNYALMELWKHYQGQGRSQYYMEIYNLTGDAALELSTEIPKALEVEHASEMIAGIGDFSVKVGNSGIPMKNIFVTVKYDNGKYKSFKTNDMGEALINLSIEEAPPEKQLELFIYTSNNLPYLAKIPVIPSDGAYLVYNNHQVIDNDLNSNSNMRLNPGEIVDIEIKLKNVGSKESKAFSATIDSASPYVKIVGSNKIDFDNISAGAVGVAKNKLRLEVLSNTPNKTRIPFTINWQLVLRETNGVSSGKTSFYEIVYTATPVLVSAKVQEATTNSNSNGYLDPNESGLVTLTLSNIGDEKLKYLNSLIALSTTNNYVQILEAEKKFPADLDVAKNTEVTFSINVGNITSGTIIPFKVALKYDDLQNIFPFETPIGTQIEKILNSNDTLPMAIPDQNFAGIMASILSVPRMKLTKVSVVVRVTHTYIGDLRIVLQTPSGKKVTLHNKEGSSSDNIDCIYGETCTSKEDLNAVINDSSEGDWKLFVSDEQNADTGTLDAFAIKFYGYAN